MTINRILEELRLERFRLQCKNSWSRLVCRHRHSAGVIDWRDRGRRYGMVRCRRTEVPLAGYFAMAIGVTASLVVGIGLMALVFYSSRAGYDEPAKLIELLERDQTQK
jgi:hypothetical protein